MHLTHAFLPSHVQCDGDGGPPFPVLLGAAGGQPVVSWSRTSACDVVLCDKGGRASLWRGGLTRSGWSRSGCACPS